MDFVKYLVDNHDIHLNEQQQRAVTDIEGPVLLLAVPGGGKTTVIVSRCANMVLNHGINPDKILTLTFSKAAALDMKLRFQSIFGKSVNKELNFSTIHSFCYSVLRTYMNRMNLPFPGIIEDEKATANKSQILRQLYQKHNNAYIYDDKLEELSNAVSYVKNMMLDEEERGTLKTNINSFADILSSYEAYKRQYNYMDFDDMLTMTLDLFNENEELLSAYRSRYTYINLDESQDTSLLQHRIIKCLANPRNNLFMVGDEDQSIYTFRAAFPKALLDFENTYPGSRVYLMERNYRSSANIVSSADKFIKQNKERHAKNMVAENGEGKAVKYTCLEDGSQQYEYIVKAIKGEKDYSSTAILYRNNISAIPLADMLQRSDIPFYLRESRVSFFKHWITADILSFLSLSSDGDDVEAFKQIYYKMNAYITKGMVEYAINRKTRRNLFDELLGFPGINIKLKKTLQEKRRNISKISDLAPLEAIEFIIDEVDYGEYLKKQSKEGEYGIDGLMQIVSVLKSIASRTESITAFRNRLEYLQQVMDSAKFNKGKSTLTLSTVHSSKGLEFDRVFIIDLYEGQFPSDNSIGASKEGENVLMEEEVRLFYVGATRARQYLELLSASTLDGKKVKPSCFIDQFLNGPKPQKTKNPNSRKNKASFNKALKYNLTPGMTVIHKKFGLGCVISISSANDTVEIRFENKAVKLLSLKTCLEEKLIEAI